MKRSAWILETNQQKGSSQLLVLSIYNFPPSFTEDKSFACTHAIKKNSNQ